MNRSNVNFKTVIVIVFLSLLCLSAVFRVYFWYAEVARVEVSKCCEGIISNHPYVINEMQLFELDGVFFRTPPFPKYYAGDYLKVIIQNPKNQYINHKPGERVYINYPKVEFVETESDIFLNLISVLRESFIKRTQRIFPEPHASLILGMTVGFREDLPPEFRSLLRRSGTVHTTVVSGFHVSIVIGLASLIFIRFGKLVFIPAAVIVLVLFILFAGMNPSAVRAGIMGLISIFALANGQYRNSFYLLILTGFTMIIIDPAYLFNVSFQLSFVANSAVIYALSLTFGRNIILPIILVPTFVNLAIAPITSYYFEQFSLIGIPANILIFWIIPIIALGGAISVLFDQLIISSIIIACIDYFIAVITILDNIFPLSFEYKATQLNIFMYYILLGICLRFIYTISSRSLSDE